MTAEQRLERDLPFILDEIVVGPYPDYIDDVLSTTARRRQRPGWAGGWPSLSSVASSSSSIWWP